MLDEMSALLCVVIIPVQSQLLLSVHKPLLLWDLKPGTGWVEQDPAAPCAGSWELAGHAARHLPECCSPAAAAV